MSEKETLETIQLMKCAKAWVTAKREQNIKTASASEPISMKVLKALISGR